ncbi:hypothetical protein BLJ79_15030 [Arthrobacter sp. UCD-GKA]|nr:hypothetical protein BLJ79_15030 [Arthrobacter sp. UCD-GKA]
MALAVAGLSAGALAATGFTPATLAAGVVAVLAALGSALAAFVAAGFWATVFAAAPVRDADDSVAFFAAAATVLAAVVRVVGAAPGEVCAADSAGVALDASGVLPVTGVATRWSSLLGWPIFLPVVFARAVMALLLCWGKRSNPVVEDASGVPDSRMQRAFKREARRPSGKTVDIVLRVGPGAAAQDLPLRIHPFLRQVQPT